MPRSRAQPSSSQEPATAPTQRRSSRLAASAAKASSKEVLVGKEPIKCSSKPRSVRKARKPTMVQPGKVTTGTGSTSTAPELDLMEVDTPVEAPNSASVSISIISAQPTKAPAESLRVAPLVPSPVAALRPASKRRADNQAEEMKAWAQGLADYPTVEEIFAWALCTGRPFVMVSNWVKENWSSIHRATKVAPQSGRAMRVRRSATKKDSKADPVGPTRGVLSHREVLAESSNGQVRRQTRATKRHNPISRHSSPPPPAISVPIIVVTSPPASPQPPVHHPVGRPTHNEAITWKTTHDGYELTGAGSLYNLSYQPPLDQEIITAASLVTLKYF
ncbi:hypothetical protein FRC14_007036 [Serendipita sp. 396]|nr:hypothetical protein FRC14_007036 [Serendipita sp. 396]KAG8778342.1 hypothetical protein FRC15_010865 [Serendipita sp. 397]KAG8779960.1 hypothetical protein FRC16_003242 [Serendipita sp. 398]KAG8863034.1 hypothetical protein FRC20_010917 [Serendipita sp. 405]